MKKCLKQFNRNSRINNNNNNKNNKNKNKKNRNENNKIMSRTEKKFKNCMDR